MLCKINSPLHNLGQFQAVEYLKSVFLEILYVTIRSVLQNPVTYMCVFVCVYIYVYTYVYILLYVCMQVYTYIQVGAQIIYVCVYTHIFIFLYSHRYMLEVLHVILVDAAYSRNAAYCAYIIACAQPHNMPASQCCCYICIIRDSVINGIVADPGILNLQNRRHCYMQCCQ